jgi:hypothetical protein
VCWVRNIQHPTSSLKRNAAESTRDAKTGENALQGRKSAFKLGDNEPEVHECLDNCRKTPMHPGELTLSEPGIRIWTPATICRNRGAENRQPRKYLGANGMR